MVPLRRNRDFVLLQAGQLLSALGSSMTAITYPLLVLAVSHSPAQAGLVGFARIVPQPLFSLGAGVVADRFDRKRVMIAADSIRGVALGLLGAAVLAGHVDTWEIAAVAFVEGVGSVVFGAALPGALRAIVPGEQLSDAAGAQEARNAAARVGGPSLGGVLFGLGRAVPFLADAVSYAASIAALSLMRATFQEQRAGDRARLRVQIAEGFRFLWREAFLRTTAFVYGLGNFTIPGILFVVVVAGRRQGLSPAAIGVLTATIAACTFVGALLSPLVRRRLSARGVLLTELWATVGSAGFLVWPNVYVLVAGILPQAATFPVTDSVVKAYAIAVTPDRLLGRVESARRLIALLAAPLGPLVAGLLLETLSARATVGFFLAVGIALAMVGTASRALRSADYPAASAAGRSARRYKTS